MPADLLTSLNIISRFPAKPRTEYLALTKLQGKINAENIYSPAFSPQSDRSRMDGIAYNSKTADTAKPLTLMTHLSAAEVYSFTLTGNDAVQLSTGSYLPFGADTVVPVEDVRIEGGRITILNGAAPGRFIEKKGKNFNKGELVISAGTKIDSWHIETLASLRINSIKVLKMPHIGILSTGSEITEQFGEKSAIVNSNYYGLSSLLEKLGVSYTYFGVVEDNEDQLVDIIQSALGDVDALVTFGGTAKGKYDLMRAAVVNSLGGNIVVDGVETTPGRTFRFASVNNTPVFILPGTPAAALICSEIFLTSWLLKYRGVDWQKTLQPCRITFEVTKRPGFSKLIPCWIKMDKGRLYACERDPKSSEPTAGFLSGTLFIEPDTVKVNMNDQVQAFISAGYF